MAKVRILFQLLSVFPKKMQKSYESNWRKVAQKSVFFEKIEAKNGSFLIKNEENLHPYQKILTSFLIWVMLLFGFI